MITKLRLKNFKCFEEQVFHLAPLTLLCGQNGMGKSSMLQSLLLLRQSYQQGMLGDKGLMLNGELVKIGTAKDALFENASEEIIEIELGIDSKYTVSWSYSYSHEADVLSLFNFSGEEEVFKTSLFTESFHYLGAERIGPRKFTEISDDMVRNKKQLGGNGEYTTHFLYEFGNKELANKALHYSGVSSNKLRDQVEAWLGEVCPGTRIQISSHPKMDLVNLEYAFKIGKSIGNSFRSTNVGFGITYTLPVIVALLSATPDQLVLIENPEAHLHPKGQVKIGELLALAASCGVQVILETHSDHILNGVRLSVHKNRIEPDNVKIYYFSRNEQELQTSIASPRIDINGRIDFWPSGFFDVWDECLEELLKPKTDVSD